MSNTHYRADESFGHMSITTYRVMHSTFRRVLKDQGIDLTPEQWGILLLLWEKGSATQDELASASCVDKSSISRVLSLMEDKGLLNRRIDPDNERKKAITAAEKSFAIRESVYAVTNQIMKDALKGITREEADICMKVLTAIRDNLRETY